jgi:hypothetical protein
MTWPDLRAASLAVFRRTGKSGFGFPAGSCGTPAIWILLSRINLTGDWSSWKEGPAVEILRPERSWEGADAPLVPSIRSTAYGHVNQLRDPAIFEENGRAHLFYAVAGGSGIAIAELVDD